MSIPNWIKEQAKALAAFAAGFIGNMIVGFINGDTAWPQNKEEWIQYLLTSAGAALAAYFTRNKITQKQIDKDPHVVGGVVVDDEVPPPAPSAPAGGVPPNPYS